MWGWLLWSRMSRRAEPVSPRLKYEDVEALGPLVARHFELLAGNKAEVGRNDPMWVDLVQFVLRRAVEIHEARGARRDA